MSVQYGDPGKIAGRTVDWLDHEVSAVHRRKGIGACSNIRERLETGHNMGAQLRHELTGEAMEFDV